MMLNFPPQSDFPPEERRCVSRGMFQQPCPGGQMGVNQVARASRNEHILYFRSILAWLSYPLHGNFEGSVCVCLFLTILHLCRIDAFTLPSWSRMGLSSLSDVEV